MAHKAGANTPNWDLAAACEIEGKSGLVFVEAKANWPELQVAGKPLSADALTKSRENHDRIRMAVSTARDGLKQAGFRTAISIDSHYQLANRIAFMWKLAMLGVPTVLIYLGFTGDDGISDAGKPFADADEWNRAFNEYARDVVSAEVLEKRLHFGTHTAIGALTRLECGGKEVGVALIRAAVNDQDGFARGNVQHAPTAVVGRHRIFRQ